MKNDVKTEIQDDQINKISESRDKLIEDANDLRARIESLSRTNECQRDEIKQLNILYQTESKSASTLEKALNTEKDNFKYVLRFSMDLVVINLIQNLFLTLIQDSIVYYIVLLVE